MSRDQPSVPPPDDDQPCPCGISHTRAEHNYDPAGPDDVDPNDQPQECGYCGGKAWYDHERRKWVHAEDGDRVTVGGPGDLVSAAHNRAGTAINPVDLVDALPDLPAEDFEVTVRWVEETVYTTTVKVDAEGYRQYMQDEAPAEFTHSGGWVKDYLEADETRWIDQTDGAKVEAVNEREIHDVTLPGEQTKAEKWKAQS